MRASRSYIAILAIACLTVPASADPPPKGWQPHKFNGPTQPVTENGVTTFRLVDKACSKVDYGDGRGESDCFNGVVRSILSPTGPQEKLGESVEYKFDVLIDPSFAHQGFYNDDAEGFHPLGWDSRLRIASWEGPFLHNFIYMLKVDTRNGITFLARQCQAPADFGKWVTFSMKVKWSGDKSGWIKVTCDDRVVHQAEGLATNQAPHCYVQNQCEPKKKKNPTRLLFLLGPVMQGYGFEWKKNGKPHQFTDIQPDGITIRMRNIVVTKGARL